MRVRLEHLPGEDCWGVPTETSISDQIRELLDGKVARELTAEESAAARGLVELISHWSPAG